MSSGRWRPYCLGLNVLSIIALTHFGLVPRICVVCVVTPPPPPLQKKKIRSAAYMRPPCLLEPQAETGEIVPGQDELNCQN